MAQKKLVALGYILMFWGALPGILVALAIWGQSLFGPRLNLPKLSAAGILLAAASGIMLVLSITQYTRASGNLPISAFPPHKLIRTGVFGIWRHPIYLFSVFFFSGAGVIFWPAGFILVAFPALALGTLLYAKVEEVALEKRFGRAYDGHRRQTAILVPRLFYIIRSLFAVLSRIFFRFQVSGRENGDLAPPFFVISAHRCYLDPFFISLALKVPVYFITTFEMFRNPTARFIFSRLLALPKKRYGPDVRNALDIRRRLLEECAIGIFPEAERSWTGAMIGFKPEALKLLRMYPDIPILPVRLEGAYAVWPRWALGPRRASVSVSIEKPLFAGRAESSAELEARLSRLIEPRRASDTPLRPIAAGGIEAVIYRCPDCLSFDSIQSGKGRGFRCSNCLARFELFSDFSIQKIGHNVRASLESVSRRIFVGPENLIAAPAPGVTGARAELAVEKRGRLKVIGTGRLNLSARDLTFQSGDPLVQIDLESVRAVVIEGARKLQIYGGRLACLFQFTLVDQSVLKWQYLIVEAVRRRLGFSPSTA
jgi:1-acyl-sn-glycerol-3-phosphate acyltransferase